MKKLISTTVAAGLIAASTISAAAAPGVRDTAAVAQVEAQQR